MLIRDKYLLKKWKAAFLFILSDNRTSFGPERKVVARQENDSQRQPYVAFI